ncbi:MAG TPA: SAM-dependent methyltransferase [Gammaproteobacteria bacterium]|uniref:class I SAM-dependent methyltransferase n=1 Tax=Immundisolibacter sp. TaxID=1934948 RepID=UPI000E894E35|nr:SAM-dependent methyltransferase [Gammaproteobacteria bacterium]HCZ48128.1 SAM-dependent methyltransferase [Gammaproteobacteria bacterium]MCH77566.1 SAM-dependent methyltransferase [Gammaproteobacteria bacterium]
MDCKLRFFPETAAGGFSHIDGTVAFYSRINALLQPDMTVLDFGAGRGRGAQEDPVPYRRQLQVFQGKCQRVIGVDVDPAVAEHPALDEYHVLGDDSAVPLADASVDLIVSDSTFEHIENPAQVAPELHRVLKPGGWLCVRTPNLWGYIGVGANVVPNRWHVAVLKRLQPHRKAVDVFPTRYRVNTRRAVRRYFPVSLWEHHMYGHFAEPAYFANSRIMWGAMLLLYRLTPRVCAPTWMIFLRKREV